MISPQSFVLVSLLIWLVPLLALAVTGRRARERYTSRRGTRYRRLTTAQMLRRLGSRSARD